jgi:hypothetical protein
MKSFNISIQTLLFILVAVLLIGYSASAQNVEPVKQQIDAVIEANANAELNANLVEGIDVAYSKNTLRMRAIENFIEENALAEANETLINDNQSINTAIATMIDENAEAEADVQISE